MTSIPFTIPLWTIFRIESTEVCPRQACQTSIEAEAVVECATCAVSALWSFLVMYVHSMPGMVHGSLNKPSEKYAVPMSSSSELDISHFPSVNQTLALTLVRWVTESKFVPI